MTVTGASLPRSSSVRVSNSPGVTPARCQVPFTAQPGAAGRLDSLEAAVECVSRFGAAGGGGFENLPFGRPNAYNFGLSLSQRLFDGGRTAGETYGLLKLLVSPVDRTLLGVHVFGAEATEVVHIGQAVMGLGGTIDYLIDVVFNYPTLAEAYKVAALDAANKLRAVSVAVTREG